MKQKKIYLISAANFVLLCLLTGAIFLAEFGKFSEENFSVTVFAPKKQPNAETADNAIFRKSVFLKSKGHGINKTDTIPISKDGGIVQRSAADSFWTDKKSLYLYDQINKDSLNPFPSFPQFHFNLAGFTAQFTDSVTVLSWTADINENVQWFIVERSIDGKNYYMLGEIDLTDKWKRREFSYLDTNSPKKPRCYYQIKALLADGSSTTSKTLTVTNRSFAMRVWIQVSEGNGVKQLMADKPVKRVEIIDENSKIVFKSSHINLPFRIPYEYLKAGTFAVRVFSENDFVTQILIRK